MSSLIYEVRNVSGDLPVDSEYTRKLWEENRPGTRVVALAIVQKHQWERSLYIAIDAIENALSPFEQYQALVAARTLLQQATAEERNQLRQALMFPKGTPIHEEDSSRVELRNLLLKRLEPESEVPR